MKRPLVQPLRMLGRYALYPPIGSGGMATVHLGRLLGPVGFSRTVAIKRLHENFAQDPQFVAMFVDEARLAARIQHPNVVDMLDVITTDGELFLVLGYVHGESLAALFRAARALDQRIPIGVLVSIIVGVLQGLHAAHEARSERGEALGIVHRDVSPHNVLVGADGIPRLLDFGVAKAAGRMHSSRVGEIKGKLAYMAREQVTGVADRRTDVYATSVILWEGLTGKRLFTGDNEAKLLREILARDVEPPSDHASGIPPELDALVLRGLAADPDARFATAREMSRALEQTTAVASASTVGEWVEGLAHESLVARSRQVEAIEESSAGVVPSRSSDRPAVVALAAEERARASPGDVTRSLPGGGPDSATQDPDAMPTQLSSTNAFEPRRSRLRRARSLALYGTIALAGLAFWASQRRPRSAPAPVQVATPPNEGDETTPAPSASTPPAPTAEPPTARATLDATAPTPAAVSPTPRRPTPRPPQPPAAARASRDLDRAIDNRK